MSRKAKLWQKALALSPVPQYFYTRVPVAGITLHLQVRSVKIKLYKCKLGNGGRNVGMARVLFRSTRVLASEDSP